MASFHKVRQLNKLKGLAFSVTRLESQVYLFIGKFLQVLLFSVVKIKNLERAFLRSFFSPFLLLVIRNYDPVSFQITSRT